MLNEEEFPLFTNALNPLIEIRKDLFVKKNEKKKKKKMKMEELFIDKKLVNCFEENSKKSSYCSVYFQKGSFAYCLQFLSFSQGLVLFLLYCLYFQELSCLNEFTPLTKLFPRKEFTPSVTIKTKSIFLLKGINKPSGKLYKQFESNIKNLSTFHFSLVSSIEKTNSTKKLTNLTKLTKLTKENIYHFNGYISNENFQKIGNDRFLTYSLNSLLFSGGSGGSGDSSSDSENIASGFLVQPRLVFDLLAFLKAELKTQRLPNYTLNLILLEYENITFNTHKFHFEIISKFTGKHLIPVIDIIFLIQHFLRKELKSDSLFVDKKIFVKEFIKKFKNWEVQKN